MKVITDHREIEFDFNMVMKYKSSEFNLQELTVTDKDDMPGFVDVTMTREFDRGQKLIKPKNCN